MNYGVVFHNTVDIAYNDFGYTTVRLKRRFFVGPGRIPIL